MENTIQECPSINLAYEFVKSSYEIAVQRFDAANNRIRNLMTLVLGFTSIIPLLAKALVANPNFMSWSFISMLTCFGISFIFGIYAYNAKDITVIHPKNLYEEYMKYSELMFKERILYWAGKHFDSNRQAIAVKCHYVDALLALLFLEAIFAGLWLFIP